MKSLRWTFLLALLLAAALSACSQAPLKVPLDDFEFKVDAASYTAGQVIYPKNPAQFNKPVFNVKTITLSGDVTVEYTAVQSPLKMTFYARAENPGDAGCTDAGLAWVCDAANETPISSEYTFASGETQQVTLGSPNPEVLADGINQGEIWIGAKVTAGAATNVTFRFTHMVANVTVF